MSLDAKIQEQIVKVRTDVAAAIQNPSLQLNFDAAALQNMPPDEHKNASDFFAHGAFQNTFKPAFTNLTKEYPSGVAWLQKCTAGGINVTCVSAPQASADMSATVTVQEPVMNVQLFLRTSRSLRSGYNSRALQDAVLAAVPQLRVGQSMDSVTKSGQVEKLTVELRNIIQNPALVLQVDLFSIAGMATPDEVKHASEFVQHGALFNTMKPAVTTICKQPSGVAWLRTITLMTLTFISAPQQTTDLNVQCQLVAAPENGAQALAFTMYLRTSRSLRSGYNSKACEEAIVAAVPALKTGKDMDLINNSGQVSKTLEALRSATACPALSLEVDLWSIANMPQSECSHAAEFVAHGAMFNTLKGAFTTLTKAPSGKAWLATVPLIKVSFTSCPAQSTDLTVNASVVPPADAEGAASAAGAVAAAAASGAPGTLILVFNLRTSRSLRSGYNARACEEAIVEAVPQLRTGQHIDLIHSSSQIAKTLEALRELVGSPALTLECDLWSIANMPSGSSSGGGKYDECKHAAEFVAHGAMFNTMKGAYANVCKHPSGKAWLATVPSIKVSFVSVPEQSNDLAVKAQVQEQVLLVVFNLRTSRSLRSGYNARAMEDALLEAIPKIRTGREIDTINASGQFQKVQEALQKEGGNPTVQLDVSTILNSLGAITDEKELHNAAEFFAHGALFNTVNLALKSLQKKSNFAPFFSQITQVQITAASAPQQSNDLAVMVSSCTPPILAMVFSLRTSRGLRSGYNARAMEDAIVAAVGLK